ncbi:hypothetical protein GCM10008934_21340 [Virgibacillus salarius]
MLTELQKKFFSKLQITPKENVKFEDLHTIILQIVNLFPYKYRKRNACIRNEKREEWGNLAFSRFRPY